MYCCIIPLARDVAAGLLTSIIHLEQGYSVIKAGTSLGTSPPTTLLYSFNHLPSKQKGVVKSFASIIYELYLPHPLSILFPALPLYGTTSPFEDYSWVYSGLIKNTTAPLVYSRTGIVRL